MLVKGVTQFVSKLCVPKTVHA